MGLGREGRQVERPLPRVANTASETQASEDAKLRSPCGERLGGSGARGLGGSGGSSGVPFATGRYRVVTIGSFAGGRRGKMRGFREPGKSCNE
jgi:hypothetical protein